MVSAIIVKIVQLVAQEKSAIYRINNKKTTKEKVDNFLKKQNKKENVMWNTENPIAKQ